MRTKLTAKKQDLHTLKLSIVKESEEVLKLKKAIVIQNNHQQKITSDSNDLYKQVENVAKAYVDKE